jgi:hypothetical protein
LLRALLKRTLSPTNWSTAIGDKPERKGEMKWNHINQRKWSIKPEKETRWSTKWQPDSSMINATIQEDVFDS